MSKSLTASKDVMKTYLSELLTEPEVINELAHPRITKKELSKPFAYKENKSLEQLLMPVGEPEIESLTIPTALHTTDENTVINVEVRAEPELKANVINDVATEEDIAFNKEAKQASFSEDKLFSTSTEKTESDTVATQDKSYRQGDFQAMYFDVAGLIIAVPLIELGGIHKVDKTTSLMGKPDWFKGVMLYREEKINVVDTALWVMPEKCDEKLKSSLNYQYIIMLNDSNWGLLAENLVDTVILNHDEVKWLDTNNNKRPWLAGLVKQKMCALLDVSALIQLLDKGSDIFQEQ